MRAVSPARAAVQDMNTDHGRLYVAMAEKFLDRADIVAPTSGSVADKWPLWVKTGRSVDPRWMSAHSQQRIGTASSDELENDHQHPMSMVAFKEGASHEAPFERRLKPDAVRIGRENHIADVTDTSWITTPWRTQRQIAKGNAVVR